NYSDEIKIILRPILLFPDLPAINDWKNVLSSPIPDEDWIKLMGGVVKTFSHQSQEATDCRWIKIICAIFGRKINFHNSLKNDNKDDIKSLLEYPNFGDMRCVRPLIRAMEGGFSGIENNADSNWAKYFWDYCYKNTKCYPEENANKKISIRQQIFVKEMENVRKQYFTELREIKQKLYKHYYQTINCTSIDSRFEGSFGLTLYAFSLFTETIFYRASLSITGRLNLRALVEIYITFRYLLQKEKTDPRIWDDYRIYGTGQVKLIYLKLQEFEEKTCCVELDTMEFITNEDKWLEFVPIQVGQWNSIDLRKMSIEVSLKDCYDKYYIYTSSFMHGNWGAIRESIFQLCINPLHRYHRVPIYELPLMPSVTQDAIDIMNNILSCLSEAYPKFEYKINKTKGNNKDIKKSSSRPRSSNKKTRNKYK
ncbi:MAG: DUF5677 domain-containing protein, partial [Methanobacteriota archaeon]